MTRIGWCPGRRTVKEMLGLYPQTGAARLFYGFRDPAPAWTDEQLSPLGDQVLPIVSMKVWDPAALLRLADGIPPGQLLVPSYHHEDEQQEGGDIPPELWVSRWVELARAFEGHPNRDRVILAPIFTRYWWEKHPGDLRYWPAEVAHLLDAVGWDVYNSGGGYRTPDDLLRIPRDLAGRTGLPYFIGELGAQRVVSDTTGAGRQAWMRAMVAAARSDGALAVCWFHRDGWDLGAAGSEPEQQTWRDLITQEAPVATTAPDNLKAARTLLLDHLGPHGLEPLAVGIVGDPAHWGGYHCGSDRVLSRDYSVVESSRDSGGLTSYASALDVGMFRFESGGRTHTLRTFSTWCVDQCKAGEADTKDIREIIYSPDGYVVYRWDRLGRRTKGDSSHLSHTHFSFHRDATKAGRDLTPLFRRYLTTIGLLEDDMPLTDADIPIIRKALHGCEIGRSGVTFGQVLDLLRTVPAQVAAVRSDVAGLAGRDLVDEQQVAAQLAPAILSVLTPQAIVGALPPDLARQVADELATRLQG